MHGSEARFFRHNCGERSEPQENVRTSGVSFRVTTRYSPQIWRACSQANCILKAVTQKLGIWERGKTKKEKR